MNFCDAIRMRGLHARQCSPISTSSSPASFESKTLRLSMESARKRGAIVRRVLRDAGYSNSETGIDPENCQIDVRFNGQSSDINQGVDRADGVLGAGDQGLMFGFACDETPELMPAAIMYAHRLVQRQAELRKNGTLKWLQPDAKSQVTIRYRDGRPLGIEVRGLVDPAR